MGNERCSHFSSPTTSRMGILVRPSLDRRGESDVGDFVDHVPHDTADDSTEGGAFVDVDKRGVVGHQEVAQAQSGQTDVVPDNGIRLAVVDLDAIEFARTTRRGQ